MPISSIIEQPTINSLRAAYRPVVLRARATNTDTTARPPVVCCDIYFNGIFYKTLSKTQFLILNATDSDWFFDIQDACQEVLKKQIGSNGGSSIITTENLIKPVYCKFRSSGYDANGFILPEGTIPIQGTGTISPVAGTGTQSNTFYVINSVLQHEHNQSIATHLGFYKNGTWNAATYPLTHRPNNYKVCKLSSDYFPIISNSVPDCIKLRYRYKGRTVYSVLTNCSGDVPICVAVGFSGSPILPNAQVGVPYSYIINLSGTAPFILTSIVKLSWMAIDPNGNQIVFSGTPTATATGITISFIVNNCTSDSIPFSDTINVAAGCVDPYNITTLSLPDAIVGNAYDFTIPIGGTAPFTKSNENKPSWMTITLTGSNLRFIGTPAIAQDNIQISLDITNSCGTWGFDDTINARVMYGCNDTISSFSYSGTSYFNYGYFYIDTVTGSPTSMSINWESSDRPNRFTIINETDGVNVATTGWVGFADYPGPWGASLSTAESGALMLSIVPGKVYKFQVEAGNGDTNDSWIVTLGCA